MLEVFIIGKCIPAARHIRIGSADIKAQRPEMRRAAVVSALNNKVRRTCRMVVPRMSVHVPSEIRTVLPVVKGNGSIPSQLILRAYTDDIGKMTEFPFFRTHSRRRTERIRIAADGTQIPGRKAESVSDGPAYLQERRPVDRRNIITLQYHSAGRDNIARIFAECFPRQAAVTVSLFQKPCQSVEIISKQGRIVRACLDINLPACSRVG